METSIPVLKTCIDCFTVRASHPDALQLEKVVSLVFKRVLKNSNLQTLISHALQDADVTDHFVDDLTNSLGFSIPEKIRFALVLADFERSDAKTSGTFLFLFASSPRFYFIFMCKHSGLLLSVGRNLLLAEIEKLCATPGQIESTEEIQNVVLFLQQSEDLSSHLDSFLRVLSSAQPRDDFSFALTPFLSPQDHESYVFRCGPSFIYLLFISLSIL